jgi:ornithine carbamoyltransferase
LSGLQVRLGAHADLVDMAERAGVPVINGGTDCNAPCQVQTMLVETSAAWFEQVLISAYSKFM